MRLYRCAAMERTGAEFSAEARRRVARGQPPVSLLARHRAAWMWLIGILFTLGSTFPAVSHSAQVTFQWDYSDPRATGFVLQCGPTPGGPYDLRVDVGSTTTATVSGFTVGGTYNCVASAYSPSQTSAVSNEISVVPEPPPIPELSIDNPSGPARTVRFTGSSSDGPVTRWAWDFGDGTGSTEQNPTHAYTTPGSYTVALTASGPGGSVSKTASVAVTVTGGNPIISAVRTAVTSITGGPPVVSFASDRNSGIAPFTVAFTNKTAGGTSWMWEFTNGVEADRIVSSEQNPTITFYKPGTWTVTLTASGPGGTTAVSTPVTITVAQGATGGQAASQSFSMPAASEVRVQPECGLEASQGIVLGDDVLGTPDPGRQGVATAFSTIASECGNVDSLSVYLDGKSTATRLVVGLYSDQGGHPGTLLAQGAINKPVAGAWNTVAIPHKRVVKDAVYWIAILGGQSGTVYYHTRAGACAAETSAQTGLATLPSAWFTGSIVGACPVAAYGTSKP